MKLRYLLLAVVVPVLCGCAAKQRPATNWRLTPGGRMLLPPQPPQGQSVLLRNARSVKKGGAACNLVYPEIQLEWRGRTARVSLSRDITGAAGGDVALSGPVAASGVPVVDLSWWTRFSGELAEREKKGCLAAGDAERLIARIIENMPMPSSLAYQLRYGNFIRTGFIELEPTFILRSVAPLLKPGVEKYRGSDDIAGYETVLYDVKRRGDNGVRIATRSVEQNMLGKVVTARRPATEVIALPDSARFARYYFRMWSLAGDRKLALLAARSPELLARTSSKFEADPEGFCKSVKPEEAACLTVPSQMMIAPELRVFINGKPAYVLVGGNIGQVLRGAGVKDAAALLPRLQVTRPYAGTLLPVEFDRSRPDIFSLIPIGGEQIRY